MLFGSLLRLLFVALAIRTSSSYRRLAQHGRKFDTNSSLWSTESTEEQGHRLLSDVTAENHLVTSLPGLTERLVQYAGHVNIDQTKGSNIFYWLFEAPQNADKLPLLIWLNGGPGCSSMDGLWLELGPLRLDPNGASVSINRHSWHNVANLLFIDQPVGTGFAYTKAKSGLASNDDMVNTQFYKFLQEFFKLHPRYVNTVQGAAPSTTRPLFISGESHAGHYIPTMAAHILQKNAAIRSSGAEDGLLISLEGIALGNPWLDPYHQYDASDFAHGLGLISQGQKYRLKEQEKKCQALLKSGKLNNPLCFSLLDKIVDSTALGATERVLMYDTRKYVKQTSSFPPGHEPLERYLNRADVKSAIHATTTPHKFEECANPPFYALSHQDGKGVMRELTEVLDLGLRVLVFAGQYDLICNHLGIERVLRRVPWRAQRDWLLTPSGVWAVGGKPQGYVRAHKNLEFLIVLDSGHMVPMDQPAVALTMIQTFLQNRRFAPATPVSKLTAALAGPDEDPERCPRVSDASGTFNSSIYDTEEGSRTSTSSGVMSGLDFWTGFKKPQQTRKPRQSRRNNLKGSPQKRNLEYNRQSEQGDTGRRLEDEIQATSGASSPVISHTAHNNVHSAAQSSAPYALIIGHVVAFNQSARVHVRLVHHGAAAHLQQKHHLDSAAAAQALQGYEYELRVDPGNRVIPIDLPALLSSHLAGDVTIDALRDGQEYVLSTWVGSREQAGQAVQKHASSRRTINVTPGCFNPDHVQCCGNGLCVAAPSSSGPSFSGVCQCDTGYVGPSCAEFAPHGLSHNISTHLEASVTCPAHSFPQDPQFAVHPVLPAPGVLPATVDTIPIVPVAADPAPASKKPAPANGGKPKINLNVCPGRSETSGNPHAQCSASLELRLTLRDSANSWLSPARFNAQYQKIAADALLQDILHATASTSSAQGVLRTGQVNAGPCEFSPPAGDVLISDTARVSRNETSAATPLPAAEGLPYCLARVTGPASAVTALVTTLLGQMEDSMSPLRSGLISAHLHQTATVVISHDPAAPSSQSDGYGKYGWIGAAAVVVVVLFLVRKRRQRNVAASTVAGLQLV